MEVFSTAEIQGKRGELFWDVEQPTEAGYKGPQCPWDRSGGRHLQVDRGLRAFGSPCASREKGYRQSGKYRDTEV